LIKAGEEGKKAGGNYGDGIGSVGAELGLGKVEATGRDTALAVTRNSAKIKARG